MGLFGKVIIGLIGAAALASGPALAQPDAQETVLSVVDAVYSELQSERERISAEPQVAYALIERGIEDHIDFPIVARLALGKHWRTASPAQRETFTSEFRTLLVRFYGRALMSYIAERGLPERDAFRILPQRGAPNAEFATVRSQIVLPDSSPIPVDYSLRRSGEQWKIYDVSVEGISVVTSYRNNFAREIDSRGLDAVIQGIRDRNREAQAS
jgi:phospholipid transport system substrate-binding protein